MNIAEAVSIKLENYGIKLTEKNIIDTFNEYKENVKVAAMEADQTNFIISFDDGSCIRITFGADHIKVEVGEDMLHRPEGSKLSS